MSATPVLDDFDMNYSEILKGRLEDVISLLNEIKTVPNIEEEIFNNDLGGKDADN